MTEEQYATLRHIDLVLTIFLYSYFAMCAHRVTVWYLDLKRRDPWPPRREPGMVTFK